MHAREQPFESQADSGTSSAIGVRCLLAHGRRYGLHSLSVGLIEPDEGFDMFGEGEEVEDLEAA